MSVGLFSEGYAHPNDCVGNILAGDRADHRGGRVGVLGLHRNVYRHEVPGVQLVELEIRHPLALRRRGVQVHDAESFFVSFFAEVNPLQAAGVDHHGCVGTQDLVFVDMAQGNVIDLGPVQCADQEHVVLTQHHGAFRADGGPIHRYVGGKNRRHIWV